MAFGGCHSRNVCFLLIILNYEKPLHLGNDGIGHLILLAKVPNRGHECVVAVLILLIRSANDLRRIAPKQQLHLQFVHKAVFAKIIAVQKLQRRVGDGIRAEEDNIQRFRGIGRFENSVPIEYAGRCNTEHYSD